MVQERDIPTMVQERDIPTMVPGRDIPPWYRAGIYHPGYTTTIPPWVYPVYTPPACTPGYTVTTVCSAGQGGPGLNLEINNENRALPRPRALRSVRVVIPPVRRVTPLFLVDNCKDWIATG